MNNEPMKLNLNFVQDVSYHKRLTRLDLIHYLLGNGRLLAALQVTENLSCRNALVLHMMDVDRYENRPKSSGYTFHQQLGPELTMVALYHDGHLYTPNPRQLANDLQTGMAFDGGVPAFTARYPADYTLQAERIKSPFSVHERLFTPLGAGALLRRVTVTNDRGLAPAPAKLFAFLVPNQSLFPEAHYVSSARAGVAGQYPDGDEFLAFAALTASDSHFVAEFPLPLEEAAGGKLNPENGSMDDADFVRPHEVYTNTPLLPTSPHLGAVMALEFDLGNLEQGETRQVDLVYAFGDSEAQTLAAIKQLRDQGFEAAATEVGDHWKSKGIVRTGDRQLDDFYLAMRANTRATIGTSGKINAGIWGFNSEWVRDSSLACAGVVMSGQFQLVRQVLDHVIVDLFTEEGMAYGEEQFYDPMRHEPDQNGELFWALWLYWVHSRDDTLIREHWQKLVKMAEFPIRPEYFDEEVSMIKSTRDIRERDLERHGMQLGYELAYQMWVSLGLQKAAQMAKLMGEPELESRWLDYAHRLWDAALNHPKFQLIENGYLMKRRLLDGSFQRHAKTKPYVHRVTEDIIKMYPRGLSRAGELEPDHSEAYPIALGMLDPESELARRTMLRMESMWNLEWDFGGYPLHHAGSEPTKLGSHMLPYQLITQAALVSRQYDIVRRNLDYLLTTKEGKGYTWWEYRDADPELQIDHGMIPWFVFSEPLLLFVHDLVGYRPQVDGIIIEPHVLPELERVEASLRFGEHRVDITIHNAGRYIARVAADGQEWEDFDGDRVTLPAPDADLKVEIWLEASSPKEARHG